MAESTVDEFGIRKIYPTNTHPNRARPWFLGKGDWVKRLHTGFNDWADYSTSTENNTLTIKYSYDTLFFDSKGRFPVLALRRDQYPEIPPLVPELNQAKLRKRGYMWTSHDWKNVEVTLYFKVATIDEGGNRALAFSVRGGPHHSDGGLFGGFPCSGTALYAGLDFQGGASIYKELGHPDYAYGIYSVGTVTDGDIRGRWIGMKGVFYTKANGRPYIELWLDKNLNKLNWERVHFLGDDGRDLGEDDGASPAWWLKDGKHNKCHGQDNESVTWGGPGVIFKLNGLSRVDMKWGSVREIMPPEGWPIRYLLNARGISPPYNMRALAQEYGFAPPVSLRELTEREAELYPFP